MNGEPRIAKFVAKWGGPCPWCGEPIIPGDEASYSLSDRVVHYDCRLLERP